VTREDRLDEEGCGTDKGTDTREITAGDHGFTTAELLANAALAVVVLAVIWGLFREFGTELIDWMRSRIGM
jgi:hypothetical protein